MDNSLEYAKMIEVPVNTCEYTYKRKRPFFKKKKVVKAVNERLKNESEKDLYNDNQDFVEEQNDNQNLNASSQKENLPTVYDEKVAKKERFKSNVITAQVVAVFALVCAIILTNVFWENSGMNTLFKSVFYGEQVEENDLSYDEFSLTLPINGINDVEVIDGAILVSGEYSLYPVCNGTVSNIEKASDGTYTVTVKHSESFSSVTEGLDLVYFANGEEVNRYMPIGYVNKSAKVYLYNGESLITDYATVENSIVFNK